jgi:hypothetical protein
VGAALAAKLKYIAAKAAPTSGKIIVVFNANWNNAPDNSMTGVNGEHC